MSIRTHCFSLLLAASAALPLWANANDQAAAQRTEAWIAAFNDASDETMKKFVESSFSREVVNKHGAEKIATQYLGAKKQLGKLKLERIDAKTESATALVTAEAVGIKMEITGNVEKAAPHYLTGVGIKPAR